MPTPLTVTILAAGLGTRMKSRQAKVLHRAGGKPLIEHVVETALALAPPERVFVVVGHRADDVRHALEGRGVQFLEQTEQKGTGHAVMVGRDALADLGGQLMILYGDCPLLRIETLRRLIATADAAPAESAGALLSARMDDPTGYGRVIRDQAGYACAVVEQKAGTPQQLALREANMGIYCLRADLFWNHVAELRTDNPAGEYYLTDMVGILYRAGHPVHAMEIADAREALGINTRLELAEVDAIFRQRKRQGLMLAGVTIESPASVAIDVDVRIGIDTVIEPCARILGRTVIGEDCRIGAGAVIRDCELGNGVEIRPYSVMEQSRLDEGAEVGPFGRLRPGAHMEAHSHIGNFVELKNTRLGPGSKANHLAYLGDSQIGARVNVGAGTITCNYDGFRKHPTRIGDGAFVGSNSTLVAPLEVGDGAYIGAGSVITDPVPADALVLGRARQVIKEDWARKRRALGKARTP